MGDTGTDIMGHKAVFKGWDKLELADLLLAYRKAKADCFFENCFPTAANFADYEQALLNNLNRLLSRLKEDKGFWNDSGYLGACRLVPKKLNITPRKHSLNGHIHFSDANKAFEYTHTHNKLIPEFRIVGDFPVDTHIISALWINMVGHKFDACLDATCYGSRLRRIKDEDELDMDAIKSFHLSAIGSFPPYYHHYMKWRRDGLSAIRNELNNKRKTIAVSLDLKSYYHLIDPSFILLPAYIEEIGINKREETRLTDFDIEFTKQMSGLLSAWSGKACEFAAGIQKGNVNKVNGGLVIGLTASRIISNVLLHKWDRLVREKLAPIHYGRYVDDMFLVVGDPGMIADTASFMTFLQGRLGGGILKKISNDTWRIDLGKDYQAASDINFRADKQKIFVLDGQAGLDLLDSIEKDISELSSERRLMPAPDQLENSPKAKVLSAAGQVGEKADTLRRADGLTIRRLGWALQLRHVETLANDLPNNEWREERQEFYIFSHNHILRADRLFDHYPYLSRLLGFATRLGEWDEVEKIIHKSFSAYDDLERKCEPMIVINSVECTPNDFLFETSV